MNLMNECPRCFWLTQHKIWKRPVGIFPSLPNGMDKILKEYFDIFRDKHQIPKELEECGNIKLFDDLKQLLIWQNNFAGITYINSDGNILKGAIDYILIKNKKLIVLDFKTRGFPLKEDTIKYYKMQLNIYNFLLRKNNYETEDYAYLLFYISNKIKENGEIIFDKKLIKINIDITEAEKYWNEALAILNADCPTETCVYCSRKKIY